MVLIGSKKMFVLGLLMTGLTAILFGFLNYLPSGALFFWGSLLIRILEAIGDAAFVTSSFAISAKCFPGRITVVVVSFYTSNFRKHIFREFWKLLLV